MLQSVFKRLLQGSHFRTLNEKLYTSQSQDAWDLFQQVWILSVDVICPLYCLPFTIGASSLRGVSFWVPRAGRFMSPNDLFLFLHPKRCLSCQVEKWPINPVDVFIKELSQQSKKLVVGHVATCFSWVFIVQRAFLYQVVDFGCGDAKIAQCVRQQVCRVCPGSMWVY